MPSAWRCLLVLLLVGCAPEYELLRTPDKGEGASGGNEGVAGTATGGSLDLGGTGSGGVSSEIGGTGVAGEPSDGGEGGVAFAGSSCSSHLECGAGTVCRSSQCVTCPDTPAECAGPCEHGFEPLLVAHNGCGICECAPVSACSNNADCDVGQECYAGSQCEAGCSDPSCCRGNRCGAPGCAGLPIPHCVAAGCAGGAVCLAACDAVSCECDGKVWQCAQSPSTGGASGASCPQACVSP